MKVLGIVAEYNPFHNGHLYQLKKSIEAIQPDYTVAVMSGNFTQRGEPAFASKWTRSEAAIKCGIDLVIELPFAYACNNAEYFAKGAISILNSLGCITHLSFGSECGDVNQLKRTAELLALEPPTFKNALKLYLAEGLSYPKARELAIEDVLGDEYAQLANTPNNILGLEYLKQLILTDSKIEAFTLKRFEADYHDTALNGSIASATAIRKAFSSRDTSDFMPIEAFQTFTTHFEKNGNPLDEKPSCNKESYAKEVLYKLICSKVLTSSTEELSKIFSVKEGLENKLKEDIRYASSIDEFKERLISKRYTQTRINRMLLHVLFGLSTEKMHHIDSEEKKYARILGFNEKGSKLIKHLKKNEISAIPLITNINKERELLFHSQLLLSFDTLSSDLYNLINDIDLYKFSDFVIKPAIQKSTP